jgi:hypothetical protein
MEETNVTEPTDHDRRLAARLSDFLTTLACLRREFAEHQKAIATFQQYDEHSRASEALADFAALMVEHADKVALSVGRARDILLAEEPKS